MMITPLLALALQLPAPPEAPIAIVNIPRLVAESMIGKAATAQLKAVQAERQKVLSDKQVEVQTLAASRAAAARIQRAQVDLQRMKEDANAELAGLDRQLQEEFDKKLRPAVARIADEEHIGIIFEYPQQPIVWAAPFVDITSKVIERLDAAAREKK